MTSTPDRRFGAAAWAAVALLALAGTGLSAATFDETALIERARAAIAKSDGIAAEADLQRAIEAGAAKADVAAEMGDALILQGEPGRARDWLAPGQFAAGRESYGWRTLGRLERLQGHLSAAGRAYDQALRHTPDDSLLWVEIGRLRYAGGEHLQALDAADKALAADPRDPRALEFRGQLVRDQHGLVPALKWLEASLVAAPNDLALLGEYAGTLGELNQARAMLRVTWRMLELDPGNARARYLQAVLAARAGKVDLARTILGPTGERLSAVPAAMLLRGILELEAGNANLAVDVLDRLLRLQPANERARLVLARAAYVAGDRVQLKAVVQSAPNASPYLSRLLGASSEPPPSGFRPIGTREDLRVLAADWNSQPRSIGAGVPYIRKLLSSGNTMQAEVVAESLRRANPGSADIQAIAGDVQLVRGHAAAGLERYRIAARVRLTPDLVARMAEALDRLGQHGEADRLVEGKLGASPTDLELNRLASQRAKRRGDKPRAKALDVYIALVA